LRTIGQAILAAWFALCVVTLADAAMAQGGQPPEIMIQKQDKDGDGRISRDEWRGPPEKFDKIDQDRDGFLSLEELNGRDQAGAPAQSGGGPPVGAAGPAGCKQACAKKYHCTKSFGLEILGYDPDRKSCAKQVQACLESCNG
jgi:hypothetical protein